MSEKKAQTRGRPKKDFWELKTKLAQETAENKWKFKRWRPKKRNMEIVEDWQKTTEDWQKTTKNLENYSKIVLCFAVLFFICTILYKFVLPRGETDILNISELNNLTNNNIGNENLENNSEKDISLQIEYTDSNWNLVEIENIDVSQRNVENESIDQWNNASIENEDTNLIRLFYDEINNRNYANLSEITDKYLRQTDTFRTYFSSNRLSNFLDKIAWNKVYIWNFQEIPTSKQNVKNYSYIVKYKVNWENALIEENRGIAIIDRNWKKLIWSIMCVTTWCSRMPFFQK